MARLTDGLIAAALAVLLIATALLAWPIFLSSTPTKPSPVESPRSDCGSIICQQQASDP